MSGFITSTTSARRHGAYAIERQPPLAIRAAGTGVVAYVAQLPWGPDTLTTPTGAKQMFDMFGPRGATRTGSGYLGLLNKGFPALRIMRVLGTAKAKATAALTAAGPTTIVTLTAKYHGTTGNSLTATVAAASDGDANHFNLTVTLTGASGTTTDEFVNLNYSGTGTDSAPTFTSKLLVGAITKSNSGRPTNGSYSFSTGADGTINAAAYTGTAGAGDLGIARLEGDNTVRHVSVDDPGNSLRASVNAALKSHAESMGDRVAYINGNSGLTLAQTATDVANYRSKRVYYMDPWVYIYDDVTGAEQLVPPAIFAASVKAQLSPSTSLAWKNPVVMEMLRGVVRLEADRGAGAADNTDQGVVTMISEENGGFTFECGKLTIHTSDPSVGNGTRTHMGDYIAQAFVRSTRSIIDAPNVPSNRDMIVQALETFMAPLKRASTGKDPNSEPHVLDYAIPNLAAENSQASLDNGDVTIPLDCKFSSGIERLFLGFRFGESVTVTNAG